MQLKFSQKIRKFKNTKEVYIGDDNKIHPNYIFNCISNPIQNNYVK